jgi:hypothetical protein
MSEEGSIGVGSIVAREGEKLTGSTVLGLGSAVGKSVGQCVLGRNSNEDDSDVGVGVGLGETGVGEIV